MGFLMLDYNGKRTPAFALQRISAFFLKDN